MPRPHLPAVALSLFAGCIGNVSTSSLAQQPASLTQQAPFAGETLWSPLTALPADVAAGREWVRPEIYRTYALNFGAIQQFLNGAPREFTMGPDRQPLLLALPTPEGDWA